VHETTTLIARNFAKYSPILISSSRLFCDVIVSQSRVTKYAKSCGIISNRLTANLLRNLPVKKNENRLIFDRIMAMNLWPNFF